MYECEAHKRGHRTEEARIACVARTERRARRALQKKADEERRQANLERESVDAYVKRRFCIEGTPAVNVAASLNRDYPRRGDGRPWDWAAVVTVHAEHLRWPVGTEFEDWLAAHPEVLLPSEVRKLAGVSDESARD
jgi:hypothetical protein